MSTKNIDDLTIDEIKEQMALFTRLEKGHLTDKGIIEKRKRKEQ